MRHQGAVREGVPHIHIFFNFLLRNGRGISERISLVPLWGAENSQPASPVVDCSGIRRLQDAPRLSKLVKAAVAVQVVVRPGA